MMRAPPGGVNVEARPVAHRPARLWGRLTPALTPRSRALDPARPKLLVLELWGIGDLALATDFLRAATARFAVSVVAKPAGAPLLARLAPDAQLIPFVAPWTAFTDKYRLHRWPWRALVALGRGLRAAEFAAAVSARADPRDHALMAFAGAERRLGFGRRGSEALLTTDLKVPGGAMHRYEAWRRLAQELGLPLIPSPIRPPAAGAIVIHTGAGHPVRVWPLPRVPALAEAIRSTGNEVRLLCDPSQAGELRALGETPEAPTSIEALLAALEGAPAFVGNDSGPGHVAAALGVPTYTVFGPQVPELFLPIHPLAAHTPGLPCPHKPCWDRCRLPRPHCILDLDTDAVVRDVLRFLSGLPAAIPSAAPHAPSHRAAPNSGANGPW